jgi:preprotein translocase subunit SecF
MEIIPPGTKIDFVRYRKIAILSSAALIAVGMIVAFVRGPNLGIDFSGGSLVHVRFEKNATTAEVRKVLTDAGLKGLTLQDLRGAKTEFLIRFPLSEGGSDETTTKVTQTLKEKFGADDVVILRVESVGPLVGQALREKALLAVLFATIMMGIYIWVRFEWRFGVGAGVALVHDVLLTIAALIVWNYEFDLTVVAALLTIVGFSVNDTVIVSDRIRENMRKDRRSPLAEVLNRSINETLSRTILTTGTALFVVLALYLLGGNVIHGFAFSLLVGFIVGTYSSIYIATPIVLFFESKAAGIRRT